jgi:hypothetical protein
MAVFNSPLDDKGEADKLVSLYTKTANNITAQLKDATEAGIARRNQILAEINRDLKALGIDTGKWIEKNIPLQYREGMQKAIEGLKQTQAQKPFYRGTGRNIITPGTNIFGQGYYISADKEVAKRFGDNVTTVYFNHYDPTQILRINDQQDLDKLIAAAQKAYPKLDIQKAIPKYATEQGYKAILGTDKLDPLAGINVLDKTLLSVDPKIDVTALFTPIDQKAVSALIDSSTSSFADALTTVGRSVRNITSELFQQEVKARIAEGVITGETRKNIANSVKQKIEDQGIVALKDKSGASWSLDRYASMLVNTQLAEARNTGLQNKMLQNNNDLVQVSQNGSSHPACADWEGLILSLNGDTPGYDTVDDAEADGLFHPNCQHTLNAVEPDLAEATYGWDTSTESYVQGITDSGGDPSLIDNTL